MEKRTDYESFLLYLTVELKRELEKEAKDMGLSLSAYIRQLLKHRKETMFYDNNIEK